MSYIHFCSILLRKAEADSYKKVTEGLLKFLLLPYTGPKIPVYILKVC